VALTTFDQIAEIFSSGSSEEYLGEDVKLVEHMLQCADLAQADQASDHLVLAALLHDIGHLLIPEASQAHFSGVDAHHDEVGSQWVEEHFPESVSLPILLHVDAKKYLVATDNEYYERLSQASKETLAIQGGAFSSQEAAEFIAMPGAKEAVQLRLWDDQAKIRDKATSQIADFKAIIERLALHQ
jgi:phosphonate degradation associated HDIG domain protein